MMKRLAVLVALVPMLASASEITPGTIELGGESSLGLRTGSQKFDVGGGATQTTDTTDYSVSLSGFYYLTSNVGVGGVLDYKNSSTKTNGIKDGLSTFLIGPAIALDAPVAPQLSVFGRGSIGYASSTASRTGFADADASGFGLTLEAGVKYFLLKSVSFDAGLVYNYASLSGDAVTRAIVPKTISEFGVAAGVSVYFGGKGH